MNLLSILKTGLDGRDIKKLSSIVCFRDGFTVPEKLANSHIKLEPMKTENVWRIRGS